ncbi:HAD family hydrolase [Neobacillus sp. Marseille-QA0830]
MIFASDLDRTLIYSDRAIDTLGLPEGADLKPVEKTGNRWVAHMTGTALSALRELAQNSLFIPVTTRTIEQFNRIVIFEGDIPIKYAITSNGARILMNGKPLEEWTEYISKSMDGQSVSPKEFLSLMKDSRLAWKGEWKQAEDLFFYSIVEEVPPDSFIKAISTFAQTNGWRISLQGRKLYFIPNAINKGAALDFICKREGQKAIAGAGDSRLDLDFLTLCQLGFVPKHGEVAKEALDLGLTVTSQTGVKAGEEILQQFLKLLPLTI